MISLKIGDDVILQKYKIVFGGKMGAGKTEAIKSLSEISVLSTEAQNFSLEYNNQTRSIMLYFA